MAGQDREPSSSAARRASDSTICAASPPGRSVRPQPPAKSVSPLTRSRSSAAEQADGALGVTGRVQDDQVDLTEPDVRTLGEVQGGHAGRDGEGRGHGVRVLQPVAVRAVHGQRGARGDDGLRVVADVVPVAMGADDESQRPALIRELLRQPADARAWPCRWRWPHACGRPPGPRRWWRPVPWSGAGPSWREHSAPRYPSRMSTHGGQPPTLQRPWR